jgi:hypothetical protein
MTPQNLESEGKIRVHICASCGKVFLRFERGRDAFAAGPMEMQELAVPSTPEVRRAFSLGSCL